MDLGFEITSIISMKNKNKDDLYSKIYIKIQCCITANRPFPKYCLF